MKNFGPLFDRIQALTVADWIGGKNMWAMYASLLEEVGELASAIKVEEKIVQHKVLKESAAVEAVDVAICAIMLYTFMNGPKERILALDPLIGKTVEQIQKQDIFTLLADIGEAMSDMVVMLRVDNRNSVLLCGVEILIKCAHIFVNRKGKNFNALMSQKLKKWEEHNAWKKTLLPEPETKIEKIIGPAEAAGVEEICGTCRWYCPKMPILNEGICGLDPAAIVSFNTSNCSTWEPITPIVHDEPIKLKIEVEEEKKEDCRICRWHIPPGGNIGNATLQEALQMFKTNGACCGTKEHGCPNWSPEVALNRLPCCGNCREYNVSPWKCYSEKGRGKCEPRGYTTFEGVPGCNLWAAIPQDRAEKEKLIKTIQRDYLDHGYGMTAYDEGCTPLEEWSMDSLRRLQKECEDEMREIDNLASEKDKDEEALDKGDLLTRARASLRPGENFDWHTLTFVFP